MRINLRKAKEENDQYLDLEVRIDLESIEGVHSLKIKAPILGKGRIYFTRDGMFLNFTANALIESSCSRCLKDFEEPLQLKLNYEIVTSKEAEEMDEEEDILVVDGDVMDLEEVIIEELIMKAPMKPLCRENCKGICNSCGQNLEEGSCNCTPREEPEQTIDPRLAKLKGLLNED